MNFKIIKVNIQRLRDRATPIFGIFTGVILMLNSCTEKIDIDLGTTYTRFVVDGAITTDTMKHIVRLSKSIDYYSQTDIPAVSNAEVSVSDGFSTVMLDENDSVPGLYETAGDYFGVPGRTYTLNIELTEAINGQTSFSASSYLNEVAPIDSINVEYKPEWEAWELQIYAWDPPTVNFYMFDVYKNGDWITDTINEVGISDDKYFNGNFTYGAAVYYFIEENPDEVVNPGDTIVLRMAGITEEYYHFVYDVMMETFEFRNPLFSGPPANISTNISNGGMGFFTAYAVSYATTVYEE
jgi:hypothetical protein